MPNTMEQDIAYVKGHVQEHFSDIDPAVCIGAIELKWGRDAGDEIRRFLESEKARRDGLASQ